MLWREMLLGWLAVGRALGVLCGAVALVVFSAIAMYELLTRP